MCTVSKLPIWLLVVTQLGIVDTYQSVGGFELRSYRHTVNTIPENHLEIVHEKFDFLLFPIVHSVVP